MGSLNSRLAALEAQLAPPLPVHDAGVFRGRLAERLERLAVSIEAGADPEQDSPARRLVRESRDGADFVRRLREWLSVGQYGRL